ncbi:MAG: glycoside hydrolase family 5 protein [Caulobacteraceae bacterium]
MVGAPPVLDSAMAQNASAAQNADPVGDWVNAPGVEASGMELGIHIKRQGGALAGTLDVPKIGMSGVQTANVKTDGPNLSFDVPASSSHYVAVWSAAKQAYQGQWTSPYGSGPLTLTRGRLATSVAFDWSAAPAPGLDYTPAPAAHARVGPTLPVGKCVNMANMLEAPKEGAWGSPIADDDLAIIKAAGFVTVRIPVSWSTHADAVAPYMIDPAFLARVHHVVDLATAAGLNVMLNVHNYDELTGDPAAHTARLAGLWRQIAASFAAAPPSVWFELLNEPRDKLTDANLWPTLAPALAAVRASNPTRPVVIGGQSWSSLKSLDTLTMPDDPNLVPTFHYYDPFAFTHQGATWIPSPPPIGRGFGSAADKAALDRDLIALRAYMVRTGRVPVMGEYGANGDPRVPLAQRIRYYKTISAAFASVGVQSCAWGYRNSFPLRGRDRWLPGMIDAISTTTTR